MPSKRSRRARNRVPEFSPYALHCASDGLWGDLANKDVFEWLDYGFPTCRPNECRALWLAVRDGLLPEWIREYPGTRPSWWFLFDPDCPRVSAEDIKRNGWDGWYFVELLPDLRRRLGGVGDPIYEHLAHVPTFDHAVPNHFVSVFDVEYYRREGEAFAGKPIDPENPPVFESEAAYLKRHNLLTAEEKRRLKRADFEPVAVEYDPEENEKEQIDDGNQ